jgi:Viral BACON domain/Putative binding domain, N-terminal
MTASALLTLIKLDHELVSTNLLPFFSRMAYARSNSDFPESYRNNPNRPERLSDHDMAVAYFKFNPVPCSFSLSSSILPMTARGGEGSVSVTTGPACDWTVTGNDPWIVISSDSSGTGNSLVSFEIKENFVEDPRTGSLTIAGQTFTVVQDGAAISCSYSISPSSQSFKSSVGGSGNVTVTASSGCGWVATSNASWITLTSGSSGVGNGAVNYNVSTNAGSTRSGRITVAGHVFNVKQKGN